ncbi:phosphatase PAP2 family protein [soil metagenome]
MISWMDITKLGDVTFMMPVAAAITVWLIVSHQWKTVLWWCLLFATGMGLVIATKIAFAGWGIGIPSVDFTGFSGHSMLATSIIPVLFYLILQKASPAVRLSGLLIGILFGIIVGISRLVLNAHSVSEAVAGSVLGVVVSLSFIWLLEPPEKFMPNRPLIALSLIALLAIPYVKPAPTQRWINSLALYLSGNEKPVSKRKNHPGELSSDGSIRTHMRFIYSLEAGGSGLQ